MSNKFIHARLNISYYQITYDKWYLRAIFTICYKTVINLSQAAREAQNLAKDSFTKKMQYSEMKNNKITMKGKEFLYHLTSIMSM